MGPIFEMLDIIFLLSTEFGCFLYLITVTQHKTVRYSANSKALQNVLLGCYTTYFESVTQRLMEALHNN